jgi:hypothetical protein
MSVAIIAVLVERQTSHVGQRFSAAHESSPTSLRALRNGGPPEP